MTLADIGYTILGAFISGSVGLFAVLLRMRAEDKQFRKRWHQTARRIAQRVVRANKDSPWSSTQATYFRNTCVKSKILMSEHVSKAPESVDENLLDHIEEFISDCEKVEAVGETTAKGQPQHVIDASEDVVTKAGLLAELIVKEVD